MITGCVKNEPLFLGYDLATIRLLHFSNFRKYNLFDIPITPHHLFYNSRYRRAFISVRSCWMP